MTTQHFRGGPLDGELVSGRVHAADVVRHIERDCDRQASEVRCGRNGTRLDLRLQRERRGLLGRSDGGRKDECNLVSCRNCEEKAEKERQRECVYI